MSYSSAIFKDYNEDLVKPPEECEPLESAQMRKLRYDAPMRYNAPGDMMLNAL